MKVFVLGVGATGSLVVKLLKRQGHYVSCGDRDPIRAREFLGRNSDIVAQRVNARNLRSVVKAAQGCHLMINACPTIMNNVLMRAALQLRSHYLDTASRLRPNPFRPEQFSFEREFREERRWALIHAGVAPGLTNLFAADAAARLDELDRAEIRIFEDTISDDPVSQWSAESSFDEAVSHPRVYREGHFKFGTRFGERERFRFPPPIGRVGVVLAAQDEVTTLPRFLPLKNVDAKIGGSDINRLQRWYRQGVLTRSRGLSSVRFPATAAPPTMGRLLRRGVLRNARFAVAVLIYGAKQDRPCLVRWDARFPSLFALRRRKLAYSPIAWSTAHLVTLFIKHMPRRLVGVQVPEALPARTRRAILHDISSNGIRISRTVTNWKVVE
ncbi:MAG: saccharopine dehydrogenase NADP-binding domain-containing protein [Nitrospira sp.]|nr:saccharopine dehydrogenase NADP-binding domain-containing protein [Nitrospira sp.]